MDSNNWRVKREPSDLPVAGTPNRSFQPRRSIGLNDSRDSPRNGGSSSNFSSSPAGRSPFQPRDSRRPLNENSNNKAIEEGRRLYVGNLPYDTSVKDIEGLFQDVDGIEAINMSIDPMTGRNPSYCFVDLVTKDLAEGIMEMYDGRMFRERALRVKPGVKSGSGTGRFTMKPGQPGSESHVFNRWDRTEKPEDLSDAAVTQERRIFVGGIPTFGTRAECETRIQELFTGYNIEVIGKSIPGYESRDNDESANRNYLFVDLATAEEAAHAIESLDGTLKWNGTLKVKPSRGRSKRLGERRRLFVAGLPEFPDQETTEARIRELFEGFELTSITKLFLPKDESKKAEGNHCYCFVEVSNDEDADRAQKSLDWKEIWDSVVRVKPASGSGGGDKGGFGGREPSDRSVVQRQTWRS